MTTKLTEAEILAFLHDVESGKVVLHPLEEPQDVYAGDVAYTASNGWSIIVFNDANEWDYLDSIRIPDGRECGFDTIWNDMPKVCNYHPSDEIAWTRYGIPGYLRFRCTKCGRRLDDAELEAGVLVCADCTKSLG